MGFPSEILATCEDSIRRIKSDRRYLVLAVEEAGRLVGRSTEIDENSCRCPFHNDHDPSGSLHEDPGSNPRDTWLFTCHGCRTQGGEWNQTNPRKPSNSGDAIAVVLVAWARTRREPSFEEACLWLVDAFERRYGQAAAPASPLPGAPADRIFPPDRPRGSDD